MTLLGIMTMLCRACETALIYEEDAAGVVKVGFYDPRDLPLELLPREVLGVHATLCDSELVVTLARPEEKEV